MGVVKWRGTNGDTVVKFAVKRNAVHAQMCGVQIEQVACISSEVQRDDVIKQTSIKHQAVENDV